MAFTDRLHNRGSISTGYDVDNSVKFDKGNDSTTVEFFERNVSTTTNRYTATFSAWIKKTDISTAQYLFTFGNVDNDNGRTFARFQADQTLRIMGGNTTWLNTVRVFRDTSAWYHIVVAFDNTSGTADERVRLYVNGVEETAFSTRNNPSQNTIFGLNFGKQAIGYNTVDNNSGFNGYMCEVLIQDGIQSAPTVFGEFNDDGIWVPIDLADVSVGTNGSYLKFENAASMGAATTGVGYTVQNINQHDQTTDTCTNNFCMLNLNQQVQSRFTFSQGNTTVNLTGDHNYRTIAGSMGFQHGKWYAEFKMGTGRVQTIVGMTQLDDTRSWQDTYIGGVSNSTAYGMGHSYDGYFYRNGGSGAIGVSWTAGDIVGIAIRINDDGTGFMGMSKNGTWMNSQNPSAGTTGMLGLAYGNALPSHLHHSFAVTLRHDDGPVYANFGGFPGFTISSGNTDANGYGNFEYEVPTGYYALCSKNLAEFGG